MSAPVPIEMVWADGKMAPINQWWAKRAQRQFAEGEVYHVVDEPERSDRSHAHYFACLKRGWESLPDDMMERYPSVEMLRKKLLIKAKFCSERSIVCASKAEAQRMAAFIGQMDTYAVVIPRLAMVSVYTAESQSMRAMGKKRFQESKDAVLEALADLIGVSKTELSSSEPTALQYAAAP